MFSRFPYPCVLLICWVLCISVEGSVQPRIFLLDTYNDPPVESFRCNRAFQCPGIDNVTGLPYPRSQLITSSTVVGRNALYTNDSSTANYLSVDDAQMMWSIDDPFWRGDGYNGWVNAEDVNTAQFLVLVSRSIAGPTLSLLRGTCDTTIPFDIMAADIKAAGVVRDFAVHISSSGNIVATKISTLTQVGEVAPGAASDTHRITLCNGALWILRDSDLWVVAPVLGDEDGNVSISSFAPTTSYTNMSHIAEDKATGGCYFVADGGIYKINEAGGIFDSITQITSQLIASAYIGIAGTRSGLVLTLKTVDGDIVAGYFNIPESRIYTPSPAFYQKPPTFITSAVRPSGETDVFMICEGRLLSFTRNYDGTIVDVFEYDELAATNSTFFKIVTNGERIYVMEQVVGQYVRYRYFDGPSSMSNSTDTLLGSTEFFVPAPYGDPNQVMVNYLAAERQSPGIVTWNADNFTYEQVQKSAAYLMGNTIASVWALPNDSVLEDSSLAGLQFALKHQDLEDPDHVEGYFPFARTDYYYFNSFSRSGRNYGPTTFKLRPDILDVLVVSNRTVIIMKGEIGNSKSFTIAISSNNELEYDRTITACAKVDYTIDNFYAACEFTFGILVSTGAGQCCVASLDLRSLNVTDWESQLQCQVPQSYATTEDYNELYCAQYPGYFAKIRSEDPGYNGAVQYIHPDGGSHQVYSHYGYWQGEVWWGGFARNALISITNLQSPIQLAGDVLDATFSKYVAKFSDNAMYVLTNCSEGSTVNVIYANLTAVPSRCDSLEKFMIRSRLRVDGTSDSVIVYAKNSTDHSLWEVNENAISTFLCYVPNNTGDPTDIFMKDFGFIILYGTTTVHVGDTTVGGTAPVTFPSATSQTGTVVNNNFVFTAPKDAFGAYPHVFGMFDSWQSPLDGVSLVFNGSVPEPIVPPSIAPIDPPLSAPAVPPSSPPTAQPSTAPAQPPPVKVGSGETVTTSTSQVLTNVTVESNATFVLEPGVVIELETDFIIEPEGKVIIDSQASIVVNGSAFLSGTLEIEFTSLTFTPITVLGEVTLGGDLIITGPALTSPTSLTILQFTTLVNSSEFASVTYQSPDGCEVYSVDQQPTSVTLNVLVSLDEELSTCDDQESSALPGWGIALIAIGAIVVVVVAILVIVFANPKIRAKVSPYRGTVER